MLGWYYVYVSIATTSKITGPNFCSLQSSHTIMLQIQPLVSLPSLPTRATTPISLSTQNETLSLNELKNTLSILTPSINSSIRRWLLHNCDTKDPWTLDKLQHWTSKSVTRLLSKLSTSAPLGPWGNSQRETLSLSQWHSLHHTPTSGLYEVCLPCLPRFAARTCNT